MPLPFKIVDVNTATWSDYKNSFCAVYNALHQDYNIVSDGSLVLGDANEYLSFRFTNNTFVGPLTAIYVHADKAGSPTFNILCSLHPDNGSGSPDLATTLATGTTVPAASLFTTARLMQFSFLIPYTPALSTTYHIVFKASAVGSGSNNVRFYKDSGGSMLNMVSINTGVRAFGSGSWTFPGTADVLRCAILAEYPELWAVAIDKTNNKIRIYKSTDTGATWSEISSASAPSCITTNGLKTVQVTQQLRTTSSYLPAVFVRFPVGASTAALYSHNITSNATVWQGDITSDSVGVMNADVASNRPFYHGRRLNNESATVVQGETETVMGAARRRVKMTSPSGAIADVVGSANTPLANTLPSTATHYDLRLAFMDPEDRFHIFYSTSDSNQIQHRVLNADNTFSTINTVGSTAAVCSNTSAYPIGLGCNYYKNNEWRIAIIYLDSTSGTIKVAHCKAADSATASSWTIEQISTDTPEVTTSNLGFLSPDAEQAGQLIAFYVKSDDTLWMTKDNGTGTWSTPVQWRSGQAVAGISGFSTARNLNFQYLNTAPATDELQFDRL